MSVVVAVVNAGSVSREICCERQLGRQQLNIIYMMGEHVGRVISFDDLCHRLQISYRLLRHHIAVIRQVLCDEWVINTVPNAGYRILFIGGELYEADRTNVEIAARIPRRFTAAHRAHMRDSALRRYERPSSHRVTLPPERSDIVK